MMTPAPDAAASPADDLATDAAASWFARLNADRVSIQDLQAFQMWRSDARNDQAYRHVEGLWSRGETLRADPDIARALSDALSHPARHPRSRAKEVGFAAAASLLLAVSFGLWAANGGRLGERVYQTAVGREENVQLPDGSAVRLDTDSRLAVRFVASERRVALLRGRAFFSVAHDAHRPFIVLAGDTRVRAIGTRFSVQESPTNVQVVLVQGVVAVSPAVAPTGPKPAWTLIAGQELTVDGKAAAPTAIDVALATSWLQNRLHFHNLPLTDAIAEINRYTLHKLVLDAPASGATPVSGVFDTGDPAAFATAAADVCGLKAVPQPDGTISLRLKEAQPPS